MKPNDLVMFDLSTWADYAGGDAVPCGVLFSVRLNPHNGTVVLDYQSSSAALAVIDDIWAQIAQDVGLISDALMVPAGLSSFLDLQKGVLKLDAFERCPLCGSYPSYADGFATCCNGFLRYGPFDAEPLAIRAWNERVAHIRQRAA